jgi:hypothetical protein
MAQHPKKSEPEAIQASGNESGSTTAEESPILGSERQDSNEKRDSKATGPRTELGKQRASRNATKHGVFSIVVVLPDESRAEYGGLLAGLREAFQPEGAVEELLVEKLATITWRQRRLLLAESAEIRKNMEFVGWDERNRERTDADEIVEQLCELNDVGREKQKIGLVQKIYNPHVLERCLELLSELRRQIKENDLNREQDTALLEKIYGDRDANRLREDLYNSYETWLDTSEGPEEERVREGYASPEECRKNVIEEIESEIRRLKRYQKERTSIETARTQLEVLCRRVPDSPGLDRLLRYEASLERNFDRTLSQLERLQRMRLGQPVLPKLEVRHSLS